MIASKVQKQPKLNKVVIVAPKATAAKSTTMPKVSGVETAALPYASAVRSAAVPQACAHSQIQERAFEIYEKRGSRHGHDLQDWFRAERQVMAQ
jgi:hypothetical protein